MDKARRFVQREHVLDLVKAVFGPMYHLDMIERLRDGSKKGVYRLSFENSSSAILYVWNAEENYWPSAANNLSQSHADPFADASSIDLFTASHSCLSAIGVPTPQLYFLDASQRYLPGDIAVVEDIRGGTLETLLHDEPHRAESTLAQLRTFLHAMQQHRGQRMGKIALVESGTASQDRSCEQVVLERARQHLMEAASRDERVAQKCGRLEDKLQELASDIQPRYEYSLIHGELGPDHVLVKEHDVPVLIDIEGAMFFDLEWEHVFLQLRFGKYYPWVSTTHLDDQRMQLYSLAMHLSLVAVPLRLVDGDYPDLDFMREVAEFNLQRALTFVQ